MRRKSEQPLREGDRLVNVKKTEALSRKSKEGKRMITDQRTISKMHTGL